VTDVTAPPSLALRIYEQGRLGVFWGSVALRRWAEQRSTEERPRPAAVVPTRVLQDRQEWEEAAAACQRLRLPLHPDRPKNWDSLAAVALILEDLHAARPPQDGYAVLDAGSSRYSSFLPALSLYRVPCLVGAGLEFRKDIRRGPIRFRRADITATGFPGASFNAIACLSVIEHGVPLDEFFAEAARLLRPGGLLIVSTDYDEEPPDTSGLTAYGVPVHVLSPEDVLDLVKRAEKCDLSLLGDLSLSHPSRPIHWRSANLDYTFIRLAFKKAGDTMGDGRERSL